MNKLNDEFDSRLIADLEGLKSAPERNPRVAARARAQFLAEAVSVRDERRLSLWTIFQRKEQLAMNLFMSILVIAGLLFGGSVTVSAAQDDLPNESLYPIKLLSEDVNLWLVSDPNAEIEMLMGQARTRTQEMATLVEKGMAPPAELSLRAQERIRRALQLTASLDQPAQTAVLQQIHAQLQTQEQLMTRLQDGTCPECEPVLQQTQEMLRIQLGQIESGFDQPPSSPNQNQNQHQNQLRTTQTPLPTDEAAAPQASRTPVLNGTGQQNGNGNPSPATPMPQNHSGDQEGGGMQNNPDGGNGDDNGSGNGNGSGDGGGTGGGNDSGQGSGGQGGGQP